MYYVIWSRLSFCLEHERRATRQSQRPRAAGPAAGAPSPGVQGPTGVAATTVATATNGGEADDLLGLSASMAEATVGDAGSDDGAGTAPPAAQAPCAGVTGAGMVAHTAQGVSCEINYRAPTTSQTRACTRLLLAST